LSILSIPDAITMDFDFNNDSMPLPKTFTTFPSVNRVK
jgi:hypothetical protein